MPGHDELNFILFEILRLHRPMRKDVFNGAQRDGVRREQRIPGDHDVRTSCMMP
jgi:hypothetical protein